MAVVGSIISTLFGLTYFTVDPSFDRDNQLIGLTCGCSGLVFSLFKFYFTLISLKNIKKEVFVAEIACAAGLSILTQAVLIIVCLVFLILAVLVGLEDFTEGRAERTDEEKMERIFGMILLITAIPMMVLTLIIISQSLLMKKVSKAVDTYMLEYIHSSKMRRKRRDERRRKRAKEMAEAMREN